MTPVPPGCPRCGAHTRIGAQWCTLCYADLRPAPAATRRPDPALVTVPPAPAAGRGKHARHDPTVEHHQSESEPESEPATRSAHASEVLSTDAMLVLLAGESSKPLPGLAGRLESKGSRIALMTGGMALITVLLFAVMAVLGTMV